MKLIFTDEATNSLEDILDYISYTDSKEKSIEIRNKIAKKARTLLSHPFIGQKEPFLERTGLDHRRLIEGYYKIIYRVEEEIIYVTDIFDSRQDPEKMKA